MDRRPALEILIRPVALSRAVAVGLAVGLFMVGDSYLLLLAARRLGIYLLLSVSAATGLIGALLGFRAYKRALEKLRSRVAQGEYPRPEFARILSLLIAVGLFVIPGFATDLLGLLASTRPVGWLIGASVERTLRSQLSTLYEFLRLDH